MFKTDSFHKIKLIINKIKKPSLVLCDVDNVILYYAIDLILNKKKIIWDMLGENEDQKKYFYSIIFKQRKTDLVDSFFIPYIKELSAQKDILIAAITHCNSGKFGVIPSLEDWRANELFSFGCDFSSQWIDSSQKIFLECHDINDLKALFYKGILFTNQICKGKVVKAFIEKISFMEGSIIMIDDNKNNLSAVKKIALLKKINFVGIHYTGAYHKSLEPFCMACAQYQIKKLLKDQEWVDDSKAHITH